MSKKDKRFIAALIAFQIGITISAISLSGHYWHHSFVKLLKMQHLYELSTYMKEEVGKAQSEMQINTLKSQYEKQGVRVDEYKK